MTAFIKLVPVLLTFSSSAAASVLQTAQIQMNCSLESMAHSGVALVSASDGGEFPMSIAGPFVQFAADAVLPNGAGMFAYAEATHGPSRLDAHTFWGSVSAHGESTETFQSGFVIAHLSYTARFHVPTARRYMFANGYLGSRASIGLFDSKDRPVAFYANGAPQPRYRSGFLPPGDYRLEIAAAAFSYQSTSGMHQYSTFAIELQIPCPGDINSDGVVGDSDFQNFAGAYDLLDCADSEMPLGCPSDLNADGAVDDADFVMFVGAYSSMSCD